MKRAWLLACAALAASACVTRSNYEAEVARQRALTSDLVGCKKTILDTGKTSEKLREESKSLEAERAALVKEVESQRAGVGELREKLEKERMARLLSDDEVAGSYRKLTESLDADVKSGQLTIDQLPGRLQVRAASELLFDSGSADLKPEGRTVLAKVAKAIKGVPDREVRVEGHTDDVPVRSAKFTSNWDLSAARAATVAKVLAEGGVSPKLIAVVGYGEFRPLAPNDGAENRQKNRRIEISLVAPPTPSAERARASGSRRSTARRSRRCTRAARSSARSRPGIPGPDRSCWSPRARPPARWPKRRSARSGRASFAAR